MRIIITTSSFVPPPKSTNNRCPSNLSTHAVSPSTASPRPLRLATIGANALRGYLRLRLSIHNDETSDTMSRERSEKVQSGGQVHKQTRRTKESAHSLVTFVTP